MTSAQLNKNVPVFALSMLSMCCKKGWVWLRYYRKGLRVWIVLAIAAIRIAITNGIDRKKEQVRWMATLVKIDSVKLIEFLNDLIW